jgi:hypothetical protein
MCEHSLTLDELEIVMMELNDDKSSRLDEILSEFTRPLGIFSGTTFCRYMRKPSKRNHWEHISTKA